MTNPYKWTPAQEAAHLLNTWASTVGGFPKPVRPGTVVKIIRDGEVVATHTATGYAAAGTTEVSARRENRAMPSGWELADVCLMPNDTVVLI